MKCKKGQLAASQSLFLSIWLETLTTKFFVASMQEDPQEKSHWTGTRSSLYISFTKGNYTNGYLSMNNQSMIRSNLCVRLSPTAST